VPPVWLAALWGVTERQVRRLAEACVVPSGAGGRYPLYAATRAHCARLREQAAVRLGEAGAGGDLVAQRARLAREQAVAQEMRNAVARGELIPRRDVVLGMQGAFAGRRAARLGRPRAARRLRGSRAGCCR
jgi:terminase small subunit / prophage DNA-packing protein